jgi:hypothetical protein
MTVHAICEIIDPFKIMTKREILLGPGVAKAWVSRGGSEIVSNGPRAVTNGCSASLVRVTSLMVGCICFDFD